MSRPSARPFQPLLPNEAVRPEARWFGPASQHIMIRDQLSISTWLLLGALLQTPLYLLFGRLAFAPAFVILGYRVLDAYAQATGWKRNTYMDGVILKKTSASIPDEYGDYGSTPARDGVVVLHIGTRSNHPLGIFAPGFKQSGEYFTQMARDLDAHAEEFGFLGMSNYLNANDRTTGNETLSIAYFRNNAGLQAFAHSEYHREAWNWWNKNIKQHSHLSIFHEVFEAPKGHWETVYINSTLSGLHATRSKIIDSEGQEVWASPVVDASKGLLKTSKGRMAQSEAKEHDAYQYNDVYEKASEQA